MTGEAQIARGALTWSAVLAVLASLVALLIDGPRAAASVATGSGIILANLVLALLFAVLAGRLHGIAQMAMSLPSFAVRMVLSFAAVQALKGRPFIETPYFVGAFCVALGVVIVLQGRAWRRTPWLAQAFHPSSKEIA